jgi:hypothetical protein
LANVEKFRDQKVNIFRNADYWEIFCHLMIKDYDWLAEHYVDLTETMSHEKKKAYLRERTRRFTPAEIEKNYPTKKTQ